MISRLKLQAVAQLGEKRQSHAEWESVKRGPRPAGSRPPQILNAVAAAIFGVLVIADIAQDTGRVLIRAFSSWVR
jgi:hypothetical protein